MAHVTTMSDVEKSISKGDYSLITPSFSIYKNNGNNLFLYKKLNQPVIFIGNKKIIDSPNYVQMKGDQGIPTLHNADFTKHNYDIAKEYVDTYGSQIRSKGYSFNASRKNLNYVNYNEGKYLGELPMNRLSYVIGPNTKKFNAIFKESPHITYPSEWSNLGRDELRFNL